MYYELEARSIALYYPVPSPLPWRRCLAIPRPKSVSVLMARSVCVATAACALSLTPAARLRSPHQAEREARNLQDKIAIVRVEQIAPLPWDLVLRELRRYPQARWKPPNSQRNR